MDHRHLDLPDDRQVMLEQQIEVAVDAAADRVLDRQHAVVGRAAVDGGEHILEALAGLELSFRIHQPRGGLAERSGFSLIGDPHGNLQDTAPRTASLTTSVQQKGHQP
jgi:hypothetical protein